MKPPLDERPETMRQPGKVIVGNATAQPRPWLKSAVRFLYGTSWPTMIRVQD